MDANAGAAMGGPAFVGTAVPVTCIPLNLLISRQIKRSYLSLQHLQERMCTMQDMERKIALRDWSKQMHGSWVRLLVLVSWYRKQSQVSNDESSLPEGSSDGLSLTPSNLALLRGSLLHHDAMLNDVANNFFVAQQKIIFCQVPAYDVSTAVDVLTAGEYLRLPSCIKESVVNELTTVEEEEEEAEDAMDVDGEVTKAASMKRVTSLDDPLAKPVLDMLHYIIHYRLFSCTIPKLFGTIRVADGRAYCTVPGEFEVQVSLGRDEAECPWRVLAVRIFTRGMGASEENRLYAGAMDIDFCKRLANFLQHRLLSADEPFVEIYEVMHACCLSLSLSMLHSQANFIAKSTWRDQLELSFEADQELSVSYWRGKKMSTSTTMQGIQQSPVPTVTSTSLKMATDVLRTSASSVTSGAGCIRFRLVDRIGSHEAGIHICHELPASLRAPAVPPRYLPVTRISVEAYLLEAVAQHTHVLLTGLYNEVMQRVEELPFDASDVSLSVLDETDCSRMALRIRLYGSYFASVSVDQVTGEFAIRLSVESRRKSSVVATLQEKLNSGSLSSLTDILLPLKKEVILLYAEACMVALGLEPFSAVDLQYSPSFTKAQRLPDGVLFLRMADWPDFFLVVEVTKRWTMNLTLVRTRDSLSLAVEEVRVIEEQMEIDGVQGFSEKEEEGGDVDMRDVGDGGDAVQQRKLAKVEAALGRVQARLTEMVVRCNDRVIGEMNFLKQLKGGVKYTVQDGRIQFRLSQGDVPAMPISTVTIQYNESIHLWEAYLQEEKKTFHNTAAVKDADTEAGLVHYFAEKGVWRFRFPKAAKNGLSSLWKELKVTSRIVSLLDQWQQIQETPSDATLAAHFRLASVIPYSYVGFEFGAGCRLGITCTRSSRCGFSLSLSVKNPLKSFFEIDLNTRQGLRRLLNAVWKSTVPLAIISRALSPFQSLHSSEFSLVPRTVLQARLQYRATHAIDLHFILVECVAISDGSPPLFPGVKSMNTLQETRSVLQALVDFDGFKKEVLGKLAANHKPALPSGEVGSNERDLLYNNDALVPQAVLGEAVQRMARYLATSATFDAIALYLRREIPNRAFDDDPSRKGQRDRISFSLKFLPGVSFVLAMADYQAVVLEYREKSVVSMTDSLLMPSSSQPFSSNVCPLDKSQLDALQALFASVAGMPYVPERIIAFIRFLSLPHQYLAVFLRAHALPSMSIRFAFSKEQKEAAQKFKVPIVHDFNEPCIRIILSVTKEGETVDVPLAVLYRRLDAAIVGIWSEVTGASTPIQQYSGLPDAISVLTESVANASVADLRAMLARGELPGQLSPNSMRQNGSSNPYLVQ